MSKDWETYSTHVDGKPASVFLDLGVADDAPIDRLTIVAWVKLQMLHPRDDGQPSEDEFEALKSIEDALKSGLVSKTAAYVGNITLDGRREYYFYASSAQGWKDQVVNALHAFKHYQFNCGSRPDREWDTYFELLSPDEEDLMRMQNRRICDALQQQGDSFASERPIEHTAYFSKAPARDSFVREAAGLGYSVIEMIEPEEKGDHYGIRVTASGIPSHARIDALTLPLYRAASELGGDYDGWETQVVR